LDCGLPNLLRIKELDVRYPRKYRVPSLNAPEWFVPTLPAQQGVADGPAFSAKL
jgi:hypothetical protein